MRLSKNNSPRIDPRDPLRHVSRTIPGRLELNGVPLAKQIENHWSRLQDYFSVVDEVAKKLKAIVEPIARDNAVVVMACNLGQSELLINFVCAARARGLDLSCVLVFATDEETERIVRGLGLAVFYEERLFKDLPSQEAGSFADAIFRDIVYAKVLAVQLINHIEYDVLFQDVDIVWYKDPLTYFQDKNGPYYSFDILFQDDGNEIQVPYRANTGFYFVRYNPLTRYLVTSFLYQSDLILRTYNDQLVMNMLLPEHSSLFGLKVKTIMDEDFPGGGNFHVDHEFMMEMVKGKKDPYIFHMSWTVGKKEKLLFMRQMGMWYVDDDKCPSAQNDWNEKMKGSGGESNLGAECCLAEAKVTCHYPDKPSIIPCNHSPGKDGNESFWHKHETI